MTIKSIVQFSYTFYLLLKTSDIPLFMSYILARHIEENIKTKKKQKKKTKEQKKKKKHKIQIKK